MSAFTVVKSEPADELELVKLVRELRVGGTFWASQPQLPSSYVLVRAPTGVAESRALAPFEPIVLWTETPPSARTGPFIIVSGECDPWHMLAGAKALVTAEEDELCVIAAILGVPVYVAHQGTGELSLTQTPVSGLLAETLCALSFGNPFTGALMSPREAAKLCGFWRVLIDSNRDIAGGLGFAFWKQDSVAPLLWSGSGNFAFLRSAHDARPGAPVAVWRTKTRPGELAALEDLGAPLIEVEDGFLRSRGLGADCVPPLSITVDRIGAYFDPGQPSELELLLQRGGFDEALLARARRLRELIVDAALGKYERGGGAALERPAADRRHVLVAGQVEDDRAVQLGGCGLVSNVELLKRVREQAPDAYILYKPHPDVLAGHRRGDVSEREGLAFADSIVTNASISALTAMVDEIHVNTSLTGFEALLRGKPVTTYGVPFYAGWGLTRDLGPIPARRTARRTLDELVAATLLVYPRYLDPVTSIPCPAEVVVERLSSGLDRPSGLIVTARRLQGRLMRSFRSFKA